MCDNKCLKKVIITLILMDIKVYLPSTSRYCFNVEKWTVMEKIVPSNLISQKDKF